MDRKRCFRTLGAALLVTAAAVCVWVCAPVAEQAQHGGVCRAAAASWYELAVPGEDTLYFAALEGDSLAGGLRVRREDAVRTFRANAFFVSRAGRLLTAADSVDRPERWERRSLLPALRRESARLARQMEVCRGLLEETAYYERTHSVADEGFHQVMAHAARLQAEYDEMERCRRVADKVLAGSGATAGRRTLRSVVWRTAGGSLHTVSCRGLSQGGGVAVWQTEGRSLPDSAVCFPLRPFPYLQCHLPGHLARVWAWWGGHGHEPEDRATRPSASLVRLRGGHPSCPLADGAVGAPVFGRWGCLNGMVAGGRVAGAPSLWLRAMSAPAWWVCLWEDARAQAVALWRLAGGLWQKARAGQLWGGAGQRPEAALPVYDYGCLQRGDTLFYGQMAGGLPQGEGVMRYPDGSIYSGGWDGGLRQGYGELADSAGRRFSGRWRADTLRRGRCHDGAGYYRGTFNGRLQPDGEGEYRRADGGVYSGGWTDGLRDGFGFSVAPREVVKCGVWRKGNFRGEQMLFHSERVYGIDISKYQHVHRGHVYGIDWQDLRITHLGHIGRKKVRGTVDYPVSFVYVKCTEGLTVTNPYYVRDVRDARKHGYPVGAYHFFSTRPAGQQAAFFLKQAGLRRGDLPPVLDMELSDRKIAAMGGRDVLFGEMLVWLRLVEEKCGTTPVLYVNQDFVNRHLPFAPDELKEYPVWVARYGEYKPYVHLLYWQLSPDGTVKGIRGHVDIDVFNGTEEQFRRYLRTQAVTGVGDG